MQFYFQFQNSDKKHSVTLSDLTSTENMASCRNHTIVMMHLNYYKKKSPVYTVESTADGKKSKQIAHQRHITVQGGSN